MPKVLRAIFALAALTALGACQQVPKGLPYSVSDDCQVQRRASAPAAPKRVAFAVASARETRDVAGSPQRVAAAPPGGDTLTDASASLILASVSKPSTPAPTRPGGGGGGGFGFGFGFGLPALPQPGAAPDAAELLTQSGPQFPATFSMSCAPVQGFVRGGWPVVIDYRPDGRSDVVLEIHTIDADRPYSVALDRAAGRRLRKLDLPGSLGDTPQVALFLVRASRPPNATPGGVQLFGLGAGPRAVGSVAIDQVDFRPGTMRISQKQRASYSFYSRSDFNRSVVEIMRVQRNSEEIRVSLARSTSLDFGINRGTWIGKKEALTWDGMDASNRVSNGPHLLQVRAWANSQDARDWVAAWSPSTVVVSE
jgi:hypothetical protein